MKVLHLIQVEFDPGERPEVPIRRADGQSSLHVNFITWKVRSAYVEVNGHTGELGNRVRGMFIPLVDLPESIQQRLAEEAP